jgi:hypothetical protein
MNKVLNNKKNNNNNNKLPKAQSLGLNQSINVTTAQLYNEKLNQPMNDSAKSYNREEKDNEKRNNNQKIDKIDLLNKYKIIIYPIFFLIYFFFYFADYIGNVYNIKDNVKNLTDKKYLLYIINSISLIIIIGYIVYFIKNINNIIYDNILIKLKIFGIILFMLFVAIFNNLFFIDELKSFISLNIVKKIFVIFQLLFIILFTTLFLHDFISNNDNMYYSTELYIVFFILIILLIFNILLYLHNYKNTIKLLENSNLSLLSENCFNDGTTNNDNNENYKNLSSSNNSTIYIDSILNKYGSNYLEIIGNIPVKYFNKTTKSYSDLIVSDFYYPGSYYTYISQSPYNGIPNLEAIKKALTQFKCRFIHLDIYSDNLEYAAENSNPVIRCNVLNHNAKPLDLLETFNLINKYSWISTSNDDISYPLFLYLNIHTNGSSIIYLKIYEIFMKVFSKYLIDKKYGYCGRNGQFPISHATMTESIGKIILITNDYPTKSILDELINGSSNSLDHFFNINIYKDSYIRYDKVGISTDNNKNNMVNNSKTNLQFYKTEILNEQEIVKYQEKHGMYNPSFQDCAQYGIQGTLMYLFIPDDNLNKWYMFFKNTNSMNPVLKDESLRLVKKNEIEIKQQNPDLGFQKSQKYCLAPGMTTNKSNIGGINNSCDT